nr:MAG TPA: Head decoration protein [Caudoviricetes sp.]
MAERLDKVLGTVEYDNLIYSTDVPAVKAPVTILTGQGKLTRGTVLAINANEKCVIMGTDNGAESNATVLPAEAILAEDVDATSADAVVMAYVSGRFNAKALTVKSGYTLTAADERTLREKGIFLADKA